MPKRKNNPPKRVTKAAIKKERKRLQNKALKLWAICIKQRAGGKCEHPGCEAAALLNAHHIEDYATHKQLRYSLANGVACCPRHHKYDHGAFHRSFLATLAYLQRFPDRVAELTATQYQPDFEWTVEQLAARIADLEKLALPVLDIAGP